MCVIVFQEKSRELDKEILRQCFAANSDGVGWMWPSSGELVVGKEVFIRFEDFWKRYKDFPLGLPLGLHFRKATQGTVCRENCHPFVNPSNDLAVMHNGTFERIATKKGQTDSEAFLAKNLWSLDGPALDALFKVGLFHSLLGEAIRPSQLLMMRPDGSWLILKTILSTKIDGVWYSNDRWKPTVVDTRRITPYNPPEKREIFDDSIYEDVSKVFWGGVAGSFFFYLRIKQHFPWKKYCFMRNGGRFGWRLEEKDTWLITARSTHVDD